MQGVRLVSLKPAAPADRGLEALWGRRSLFRLQGKPLLVAEVFLPDLCPSSMFPER
ncbi:MAG: chorismate lyase [Chromatiales bacterium]